MNFLALLRSRRDTLWSHALDGLRLGVQSGLYRSYEATLSLFVTVLFVAVCGCRAMSSSDQKPGASGSFVITDDPSPSKQYEEFYKWVGICIKAWATVEDRLFDLCKFALKADPKHVSIIYYRTPTIDSRLNLTTDLIESILPKRERPDGGHEHPTVIIIWRKLVKDIKDLLSIRNQLAHASVGVVISSKIRIEDNSLISEESWLQVFTSQNEKLRGTEKPPIKDSELPAHYAAVQDLVKRLAEFLELLAKRPE